MVDALCTIGDGGVTLDRDDIGGPLDWLPPGKTAAVVFTVDDVHPGTSDDPYEAGGDLGDGALGNLEWLLDRHPDLRATLFVIPDWREIRAFPSRRVLALMPWLRDRMFLTRVHPRGTMRVDRHPRFAAYLRNLPRTDVALHGLHHVHRGANVPVEFQTQDSATIERMLRRGVEILEAGDSTSRWG